MTFQRRQLIKTGLAVGTGASLAGCIGNPLVEYELAHVSLHNSVDEARACEIAVETDGETYGPWSVELTPNDASYENSEVPGYQAFIPPIWPKPASEYEIRMRLADGEYADRGRWRRLSTATIDGSVLETTYFVGGGKIVPINSDILAPVVRRLTREEAQREVQWVRNNTDADRYRGADGE